MGLFGGKEQTSKLGVDIGASSLKVVELEPVNDRFQLKTFGSFPLRQSIIRASGADLEQEVAGAISQLAQQVQVTTKTAVTNLPGFSVFTSVIDFPELEEKDLQFAIEAEARKYVPAPLDEVVLDSKPIEDIDYGDGRRGKRMLLIAAPRDYVDKFVHIFEKTEFNLEALEISSFAHIRALIGNDPVSTIIVDIGAATTDIGAVSNGSLFENRSIDKGGQDITNIISQSLKIDVERAEQFKRDVDLSQLTQGFQQPVPNAIKPVIDSIVLEVKRVSDSFVNQYSRSVEKVILTGGSSTMRGLSDYIQTTLGYPVEIGNPWTRVDYPENYTKVLEDISPMFGIAAGLAIRETT
ncbi:type IV pilus assembly protein PilM [Patescibacteria group bacterium]